VRAANNGIGFYLREGHEQSLFTIDAAHEGGLKAAIFALYLSDVWQDAHTEAEAFEELRIQRNRLINGFRVLFPNPNHNFNLEHFLQDVNDAPDWFPVLLGLEGGRLIHNSLDRLKTYAEWGIRYLTLTHNRNTNWADSATDFEHIGGLSGFGRDVIKKCNELNILVDVSHASDHTAYDAIDISTKPVIASHSGVRSLVKQPRNLSDSLIKRIAQTGGIICVPFAKRFMGHYKVSDHINYIVDLVGVNHVGIGSDIDGAVLIPGFTSITQWKDTIVPDLMGAGWSQVDIDKILGGNLLRVLKNA